MLLEVLVQKPDPGEEPLPAALASLTCLWRECLDVTGADIIMRTMQMLLTS